MWQHTNTFPSPGLIFCSDNSKQCRHTHTHSSVFCICQHDEQLNIISSMVPLIWFPCESIAPGGCRLDILGGEKIPEPLIQYVVVSCMSAWVDSPGNAGNAKPFSGLLPRQQAMHGRRKMSWEKKRWGAHRGALTLLKWYVTLKNPLLNCAGFIHITHSELHSNIEPAALLLSWREALCSHCACDAKYIFYKPPLGHWDAAALHLRCNMPNNMNI